MPLDWTVKSLLASFALSAALLWSPSRASGSVEMPSYITGVNLGNFLVSEPWMSTGEWADMGGSSCDDCSQCAASMSGLSQKLGQAQSNKVFKQHWETWFNETDAATLKKLGLNSVRIPLSYSIVESLVDRTTEYYPEGQLPQLKRALRLLQKQKMAVLLDMHAMPGVGAMDVQFAGLCTNNVQFYQASNYDRALQWAAVMTALIHLDPDFDNVYGLEAVNEPLNNGDQTPGLQGYYDNFVKVVRSVELALGVTTCANVTDLASALGVKGSSGSGAGSAAQASGLSLVATPTKHRTKHKHKGHHHHHHESHSKRDELGVVPAAGMDARDIQVGAFPVFAASAKAGKTAKKPTHTPTSTSKSKPPKTTPAKINEPNLMSIISQQSGLASAMNATSLANVMAQTLAQAGINFKSGPASNLFSKADLASLSKIAISANGAASRHKEKRGLDARSSTSKVNPGSCIATSFMEQSWQYQGSPANGASSALGPAAYDGHLYYSFGGVANADIGSYLQHACSTNAASDAAGVGDSPMIVGEWWVQTNFDATTQNMKDFGDAQKLMFRNGRGWYYWSFKITTPGEAAMDYVQSVAQGYLHPVASELFNPNICSSN